MFRKSWMKSSRVKQHKSAHHTFCRERNETIHILRWRRKKQALMKAWTYTAAICIFSEVRLAMPGNSRSVCHKSVSRYPIQIRFTSHIKEASSDNIQSHELCFPAYMFILQFHVIIGLSCGLRFYVENKHKGSKFEWIIYFCLLFKMCIVYVCAWLV